MLGFRLLPLLILCPAIAAITSAAAADENSSPEPAQQLINALDALNGDSVATIDAIDRIRSEIRTLSEVEARGLQVTGEDRQFWSFQPLTRPDVPEATDPSWARNAIDAFILRKLDEAGISPSKEADKRTLIRRAYFDLIGLPPSPEEIEAFMADESPDAYEKLIDRLLASPRYGERWGRHWLDLARYADSGGYEFDIDRPTAYHYRDFVIKALNDDMPYDQFVQWQIAGDEYAPDTPQAIAATGFLTSGPTISNQETELNRYNELDDIVGTTGSAMLGLTVSCARCHDHKYDPISQYDYYQMVAAFTTTKRHDAYLTTRAKRDKYLAEKSAWEEEQELIKRIRYEVFEPQIKALQCERVEALAISEEDKALLLQPLDKENERQKQLHEKFKALLEVVPENLADCADLAAIDQSAIAMTQLAAVEQSAPKSPPRALAMTDAQPEPETSYYLARGNPHFKTDEVDLGFLSVLPGANSARFAPARWKPDDANTTYRRRALAEWLTNVDHGAGRLTLRVIANRLWHYHFGNGIVRTPNDFGIQGDRPSHPELLDWLASELQARDWRLKDMHKLIMMSAAYRQGTAYDEAKAKVDPNNRLWWHRAPRRLEAEIIRDNMLAVSDTLNTKMFGPGIKPYMHPDAIATGSTNKWPKDVVDNPSTWRRSVYIYVKRSVIMPMMEAFDGPTVMQSCARRETTVIPSQALISFNSKFAGDQAKQFADRLVKEAGNDPKAQVQHAFKIALGRDATNQEIASSLTFLKEQTKSHDDNHQALVDFCQVIFNLNEFIYID